MRFVSFTPRGGVLRILVLGECGLCQSLHIRNICNMKYCQDLLLPIITIFFPIVQRMDIVCSDDNDLTELVEHEGGRVTTPYSEDSRHLFAYLNHFCLDLHPEIYRSIKALSPLLPNQRNDTSHTTRRRFADSNNLYWSVMDSSSVMGRSGRLVNGVDNILSDTENLPKAIELVQDGVRLSVMMFLTDIHYFWAEIYKCAVC